jgi:16S rRNA (cytosine967-C5)-methyltransferase
MNARDWALLELDSRRLPHLAPGALPEDSPPRAAPSDPRDIALAERIVIGVVKNHLLLLHLAEHYSGRPTQKIDPLVTKILQIGLYQLWFMDRIPASAAVDEAVEQCRRFGKARASGFVNAILRNATRQRDVPLPPEQSDPQAYATIALSHPPELFRRLTSIMAVPDALAFCRHDNAEAPTLVRLYRGIKPEHLAAAGVTITPHEQPGILVVEGTKRATLEAWARQGLAQAQDATSAAVVPLLDIHPHHRVLDRCAGMGTKTLQMHEYLGPSGVIVAIDPSEPRCRALVEILRIRQINNVTVHQVSMLRDVAGLRAVQFARILVDLPCSNSGVLARRPEARYHQNDHSVQSLVKIQRQILDDTASHLAPGGLLAYSTCSVWPQENQHQVRAFLARDPDFSLVSEQCTLPSFNTEDPARYHDGGYVAILRR